MILSDEDDDSLRVWKKKRKTLAETLMSDFSELPSAKKTDLDEYAVINVSPSVVPNPIPADVPCVRVQYYGGRRLLDRTKTLSKREKKKMKESKRNMDIATRRRTKILIVRRRNIEIPGPVDPRNRTMRARTRPSRINQLWTPLGYAQVSAC